MPIQHKIRVKGVQLQLVLNEETRMRLLQLLQGHTDRIILEEVMMKCIRFHKIRTAGMKLEEGKWDHIKVDQLRLDLIPPYHLPYD